MRDEGMGDGRDTELGYLLLRVTVGLNVCMHGVARLLAGPASFAGALVPEFQKTFLPAWSVYAFGLALPWAEGVLGLLVLVGLRTRLALIGSGLLIVVLTYGSTLRQDWNAAGAQLLYAVVYAGLLAFRRWNVYSVDAALKPHE
jgi:thiosulfate dehydrogenase [quinone] large subunit